MNKLAKRLTLVEGTLSPKQVILDCLHQLSQHNTHDDFMVWLWGSENKANLARIAKEKARQRDKGLLSDAKAIRLQKEYAYLYYLALQPGIHFQQLRREVSFQVCERAQDVRNQAVLNHSILIKLKSFKDALHALSMHFFEGLPLLARDQREWLEDSLVSLESANAVAEGNFNGQADEYLRRFQFEAKLYVMDYGVPMTSYEKVIAASGTLLLSSVNTRQPT